MTKSWIHSEPLIVRTRKEESVFLYFLLESLEGITAYTTLPHQEGDLYRDLLLQIPPGFTEEVLFSLEGLVPPVLFLDAEVELKT